MTVYDLLTNIINYLHKTYQVIIDSVNETLNEQLGRFS